jgi:hypothetical protein
VVPEKPPILALFQGPPDAVHSVLLPTREVPSMAVSPRARIRTHPERAVPDEAEEILEKG